MWRLRPALKGPKFRRARRHFAPNPEIRQVLRKGKVVNGGSTTMALPCLRSARLRAEREREAGKKPLPACGDERRSKGETLFRASYGRKARDTLKRLRMDVPRMFSCWSAWPCLLRAKLTLAFQTNNKILCATNHKVPTGAQFNQQMGPSRAQQRRRARRRTTYAKEEEKSIQTVIGALDGSGQAIVDGADGLGARVCPSGFAEGGHIEVSLFVREITHGALVCLFI